MHVRAIGQVDQRPIPRVLVAARASEVTGRMEVTEAAGLTSTVYLRDGRPVHVERPDTLDRLDHVLVQAGIVPARAVAQAVRIQMESGRLLGDILRELGLVAADRLDEALRAQLQRKLTRLFTNDRGTFEIIAGEHRFGGTAQAPGIAIETHALIYPGINNTYDDARLSRELGPLAGTLARLIPDADARLREARMPSHDPLLAALAGPGLKMDLWREGVREARVLLLTLYYLDLLAIERPPVVSAAAELGVLPVTASRPNPLLAATLSPSPETWASRGSGIEWNALEPKHLARVAEQLFRQGETARAESAFAVLVESGSKDPRHQAFLTWIRFWKAGSSRDAAAAISALKVFRSAIGHDPEFFYGFYFVGEMFKLQGETDKAERAFRAALRIDSNFHDAARELRLIILRKERGGKR